MKNRFNFYSIVLMLFALSTICTFNVSNANAADKEVFTTAERMIVPVPVPLNSPAIMPNEISKYSELGYGVWRYGAGLNYDIRFDLMPKGFNGNGIEKSAKLLNFFAMTDIHITDKESPAQLIYMTQFKSGIGYNAISVYSGIMLYTTHVLDAAMHTVNLLNKQNKIDFGISLGDVCNSNQYNELRWYIDVLDGKKINPDSGEKNDPIPGKNNDYQDEFKAEGLSIPWYQVLGNHDQYWMGSKPVSSYLKETMIGKDVLRMGNALMPGGINARDYYMGTLDGSTVYGDIYGAGPAKDFTTPPQISADPNRHPINPKEWMKEFFNTSSKPVGHGFKQENIDNDFACYSFEPKSDIPIKVIVLDNTVKMDTPGLDTNKHIYGYDYLDQKRFDWLVNELKEGQKNNKLMIIAAHIPIGVEKAGSPLGMWENSVVSEDGLIAELHKYPNLMMWIAGHRHVNTVVPFPSPDKKRPELGFWGVETSSLREFPQQFRTFEIVRNNNNTISILATNVDPVVKEGSFAEKSREYAIAAYEIYKLPSVFSYNAELMVPLTPVMQNKINNLGTPIVK